MMSGKVAKKVNEIDEKLFFLRDQINKSISDFNTKSVYDASKSIISLILRREDLMSQPKQRDSNDPLYDPNDKWNEYKVDLHCNETHSPDEWDPKTEGRIANPENRHQDKILDKFCDDHPGSPMCKVFDD